MKPAPDGWERLRKIGGGLSGLVAGLSWIGILATHPAAVYLQHTAASSRLLPVAGLSMLGAILELRGHLGSRRNLFDEICLALAAAPGLTMLAAFLVRFTDFPVPRFLADADWGLLLVFPGVMLAGTALARHQILRGWNWLPAFIGLALPAGLVAHQAEMPHLALAIAMTPAAGWLVLGAAVRSRR